MMSQGFLASSVNDELFWDPRVDSAAITVSAHGGKVTLRGTVGSFRETREAKNAAERVFGVTSVDSELQVRLTNGSKRADADLRRDILQAWVLDSLVPSTVDVRVEDGFVTVVGAASWQYQRDEANLVAANIRGVIDVRDEIALMGASPDALDVQQSIKNALRRNAKVDAEDITVEMTNGTITLKGVVESLSVHDEAIAAAWAAPGVRKVDDRILVAY
jgi:osmotically-inducible protein OsmY